MRRLASLWIVTGISRKVNSIHYFLALHVPLDDLVFDSERTRAEGRAAPWWQVRSMRCIDGTVPIPAAKEEDSQGWLKLLDDPQNRSANIFDRKIKI